MSFRFTFLNSMLQRLSPRWPLLLYAATWTTLLTIMVAGASFSPELAFVSAITPTSPFSHACLQHRDQRPLQGSVIVRVPVDVPGEVICLPAQLFRRSKMDLLVPPVFAAVIVATSAYVVKALALWEMDDPRDQ